MNPADARFADGISGQSGVELVIAPWPPEPSGALELLQGADVVIGDSSRQYKMDAEVMSALSRRGVFITQPSVGFDHIDVAAAHLEGVSVWIPAGCNAEAVADWTVMAMLMTLRTTLRGASELAAGRWCPGPVGRELGSQQIGLVGVGAISQAVARRVRGFGARVVACGSRPDSETPDGVERVTFDELLTTSDVVSLHLPHNASTEGLFNDDSFALMKAGAILVNSARGAIVDTEALIRALDVGKLAAAALDTFDVEPLPSDSPLVGREDVLLTPHVAWGTEESIARTRSMIAHALEVAISGGTPANITQGRIL